MSGQCHYSGPGLTAQMMAPPSEFSPNIPDIESSSPSPSAQGSRRNGASALPGHEEKESVKPPCVVILVGPAEGVYGFLLSMNLYGGGGPPWGTPTIPKRRASNKSQDKTRRRSAGTWPPYGIFDEPFLITAVRSISSRANAARHCCLLPWWATSDATCHRIGNPLSRSPEAWDEV